MYKSKKYELRILQYSDEIQHDFQLLKTITKNFTQAYPDADKLDNNLVRLIELEQKAEQKLNEKTNVKAKQKPIPKQALDLPEIDPFSTDAPKPKLSYKESKGIERIPEEIRLLKRYILYHGKEITFDAALRFLNTIQRMFLEKRIRKTSLYAEQLIYMQAKLVELCNYMNQNKLTVFKFKVRSEVLKEFTTLITEFKTLPDTNFLKRYVSLQGKEIDKEKAARLLASLKKADTQHIIDRNSAYATELRNIFKSLDHFTKEAKQGDTLKIHQAALNGIESVVGCIDKACGCDPEKKSLNGLEPPKLMNSIDLTKKEFKTIGLTGKWLRLMGDPSKGFTAMVYGRPKMGKSYLCIDFAGYLAKNFGRTLYVAREEKLDYTLKEKLQNTQAAHPQLDVSEELPQDLSPYEFVFLDSVNKLGLDAQELERIKHENKGISFIYIFQTTKQGMFRGTNTHQHDVDVVIEIPEIGYAIQYGRFNQGGEMNIFEDMEKAA